MKKIVMGILLFASSFALAADQHYCEMISSLAMSIAQDRNQGVPYGKEKAKLTAATQGMPSSMGLLQLSMGELKTIYLDMPQLSPEGAYKLHYVACMSAQ